MWFKIFTLLAVGLLALPAYAQDVADKHSVSFDGFSFSYDETLAQRISIWHYPGDPVEGAGAGFSDAANTVINLYDTYPAPESVLDGRGGIRVYALSDLAQYDFMQAVVDDLRALVTDQPDLESYESNEDGTEALPFLPVPIHGQVVKARAKYVETDAVQGISYIVNAPTMAASDYFVSSTFWLVFQGISTDGQSYISAIFPLTTALFPEVPPTADLPTNWEAYVAQSTLRLNEAQPGDFTPSLDLHNQLIESIRFAS